MAKQKAHVAQYKKDAVKEVVKLMQEYPVIGAINMQNLPAAQLAKLRSQLRGRVIIYMAKRRLLKIAFDSVKDKPGFDELKKHLDGMPALLFTKENPFSLYKTIQRNKSNAPAKPGQISPRDILVSAGPTPFAPGPIIGELGQLGIKAGIEAGKVVIKQDKVVVKQGEIISEKVASMITRMGIEPMEIGLDVVAVYENGTIFTKGVLVVDETEYINKLKLASSYAFNLAVFAAYASKDTIKTLVQKAFNNSKVIALSQNILADAVVKDILAKAESQASSIKTAANL